MHISKPRHLIIALSSVLLTTSVLHADYVTVTTDDESFDLYAGSFSNLLSGSSNEFSMSDLEILAETLNNDDIDTEGKLSFILASTDAGLSFIGLFSGSDDDEGGDNGSGGDDDDDDDHDGFGLGLTSTTGMGTNWFITEYENGEFDWYDLGDGTQSVEAAFGFGYEHALAGFAWGDVIAAPSADFTLFDYDLTEFSGQPIQFVTFADDQWSVIEIGEFDDGEYSFSYTYIPAPGAIALFGIAALAGWRTRREDSHIITPQNSSL